MTVRRTYVCDFCGAEEEFNGDPEWAEGWSKIHRVKSVSMEMIGELDICPRKECNERANAQSISAREYLKQLDNR